MSTETLKIPHIATDRDFSACVLECDKLLTIKGHDYTQGANSDEIGRLKNFYRNATRLGLKPQQILGVYMNKHLDAIETFLAFGQIESEPIEGRICDAINYLILLFKMVQVEKRKATTGFSVAEKEQLGIEAVG